MERIYKEIFTNLLDLIKKDKEVKDNSYSEYEKATGKIFQVGGDRFKFYASLVETNEFRACKAIEKLAVKLVEEKQLSDFELYPIEEKWEKIGHETQAKTRPFQLILNEEEKYKGIVFSLYSELGEHYKKFEESKYKVDSLKIVVPSIPNAEGQKIFFQDTNEFNTKAGIDIERVTIKEFWEKYFGYDDFKLLIEYIEEFNDKAKDIIGFSTVVTPTKHAIQKFKEATGKELQNHEYIGNIPDNIYKPQTDMLIKNYLTRGLWKAMIGTSNFALSFVTSEWFFKMYLLTEDLDLTNIAAGYLKSIEQLLYEIIKLSKGKGVSIKTSEGYKAFSTDTEDIADTTLCSLERVVRDNSYILLDVNKYAKEHLIEVVDEWREKHRNGYFHKDNLQSIDVVNDIREKAYYLYFLILGSFKIKDEQFVQLGIS